MKCFQSPARSVLRLAAADSFVLLNLTKFLFVGTLKLWFRVFTSLRLNTRLSWRRMCWISEIWNKCFCEQQKLAKLFGNQQLRTSNTNETHCEGRSTQMQIPVFNVCYVCVAKRLRFGSVYDWLHQGVIDILWFEDILRQFPSRGIALAERSKLLRYPSDLDVTQF